MNKPEIKENIAILKSIVPEYEMKNRMFGVKALRMAISALTQQLNNGWIPVSEPPTEYKDEKGTFIKFRVVKKSDKEYRAYFDGTEWSDTFTGEVLNDVVAWHAPIKPWKGDTQ